MTIGQPAMPRHVLLVEDDPMHAELVRRAFEAFPAVELGVARRLDEAHERLDRTPRPDVVIADLHLPDGQGIELVDKQTGPPVVIMTGQGNEAAAVDAMRAGALDYVVKSDVMFTQLPHIVRRAARDWQRIVEHERAYRSLAAQHEIASVLMTATTMQHAGPKLLEIVCRSVGWPTGEYWQLDSSGDLLRLHAQWSSESLDNVRLRASTTVSRDEGIVGQVWSRREFVHSVDPDEPIPLRSAIGFPIGTPEEFIGVLALRGAGSSPTDEYTHLLLSAVSKQLAVFARHLRAEEHRLRLRQDFAERERLAAVGQTASKLIHELGNPLNAMYLSCQLVQRRLRSNAPDRDTKITATIERILSENRRLNALLDDFRLLTQRRQLVRTRLNPSSLLDKVVALNEPRFHARGLTLCREQPPVLPRIDADENRLIQVLANLVENAIEAMEDGGTLTLRASTTGSDLVLEIEDTGPGIPEEFDVFEPFRSTKPGSTGLGLSIAREIISIHRGSIDHRSAPIRGTIVRVRLPVQASGTAPGDVVE